VLLLDSAGRVLSSHAGAAAFWPGLALGGCAFPSLFACDIVSDDPGFLDAQWEALLATAVDRWTALTTCTPGSSASLPARVRLEACAAGPAAWMALVRPAAAPPAPPPPPSSSGATNAFRLLAGAGAAGFFDLDLARGQVHLSPTWKSMLGYTPDGIADTVAAWRDLMHPDDSAAAPDRVGRRTPPGSRTISVEYRMRHRQGHWVWIHCVGLQVVGSRGVVDRVAGLHLDISERKELEETLVASETRFNALATEGPLAAFELDFARGQCWFSPAWERLLGFAPGEVPATAASFTAALPAAAAGVGAAEWLLQPAPDRATFLAAVNLRARDGREVPVLLGVNRVISRKRELVRAFGFACPDPARPAAAPAGLPPDLAEHALHAAAEGLLVTDARGRIVFLNTSAARLLGLGAAAAIGRPVGEVFRLVNRHSGRPADDPVDAALNTDQPLPLSSAESLLPVPAGAAPVPVVWTVRTARSPEGHVAGIVIVFRNPDEMSLTLDELVKANRFEKLALAAGGIAHDFNNLLTTILGAISLAKDNHSLARLADAENSCLVAKGLSRQLLAFARGGNGSLTVCPPGELLEDTVKIAATDTSAVVTVEVAPGTGNVRVERPQLLQVFQNLVVNALQAMPPPPAPGARATPCRGHHARRAPGPRPARRGVHCPRSPRQRHGHQTGARGEDLRSLLHDQEARHRTRAGHGALTRPEARRPDHARYPNRGRHAFHRVPAPGGTGGGGPGAARALAAFRHRPRVVHG
jgi:two-component system cell cycle sensor histidine kinase/response regulator CckA